MCKPTYGKNASEFSMRKVDQVWEEVAVILPLITDDFYLISSLCGSFMLEQEGIEFNAITCTSARINSTHVLMRSASG